MTVNIDAGLLNEDYNLYHMSAIALKFQLKAYLYVENKDAVRGNDIRPKSV